MVAADPTHANSPSSRAGRRDRSAIAPTTMRTSAETIVARVTVYGAIEPGSRGAVSTSTTAATARGPPRPRGAPEPAAADVGDDPETSRASSSRDGDEGEHGHPARQALGGRDDVQRRRALVVGRDARAGRLLGHRGDVGAEQHGAHRGDERRVRPVVPVPRAVVAAGLGVGVHQLGLCRHARSVPHRVASRCRYGYSVSTRRPGPGQPAYSKCHGSGSDPPAAAHDGWNQP